MQIHGVVATPLGLPYRTTAYPVYTTQSMSTPVAFTTIDPSSANMADAAQIQLVEDMGLLDVADEEVRLDDYTSEINDEQYYQDVKESSVAAVNSAGAVAATPAAGTNDGQVS